MASQVPKPPQPLVIDKWTTGLVTNRASIATPSRSSYAGLVPLRDALIDGSNVEITPQNTLARRPGWQKTCTVAFAGTQRAFASAALNGIQYSFIDTSTKVYQFTSSAMTSLYTKGTTARSYFQQVGNFLYFSDGNVSKKTDGVDVSNAGVTAPTAAPTVPNLNLYDSVGATQTVHAWSPNAVYRNATTSPQMYYLLAPTGEIQWMVIPKKTKRVSQSSPPDWAPTFGVFGASVVDGSCIWRNGGPVDAWAALTSYENSGFSTNGVVHDDNQTLSAGTSGSDSLSWQTGVNGADGIVTSGGAIGDSNVLSYVGLGFGLPAGAIITGIQVTIQKTSNRASCVKDVTVKLLKAGTATGTNKAKAGFWPKTISDVYTISVKNPVKVVYGSNTDLWGTTWTVGDIADANFGIEFIVNNNSTRDTTCAILESLVFTVYYKVISTDLTGTAYGQVVLDSNNNLQRVKTSGTSASSAPSWSTTIGATTSDGSVTWECIGTGNFLASLFSWSYGYSFHTDSAHTSTLSPLLQIYSPILGDNVNVQAFGSADTQVDRNDVYRTTDGGGLLLFDQSASNVNASTSWTIYDTLLDTDLNDQIIGPVNHANDPPPDGATVLAYHMGRMWALVGNFLCFSAGPDCINGDGAQAWPPANVFVLEGAGTGLAATSQGLLVWNSNILSVVLGGPQKETFWLQVIRRNFGIQSQNCLTQDGDSIAVYTTQRQMVTIDASGQEEIGFAVAPTLAANFDPASSCLAYHRSGQDQGLFLCDGTSKVIRFNLNTHSWDPIGTLTAGAVVLASIDTSVTTRVLVTGSSTFVVKRDPTASQDVAVSYAAYATIGSLMLTAPGTEPAHLQSLLVYSAAVGTALTIAVLPNEISGSFTTIPKQCADPFQLTASSTLTMNRYDWAGVQSALANAVRHCQIKITLPTENAKNEIFTLAILPQVG